MCPLIQAQDWQTYRDRRKAGGCVGLWGPALRGDR